MGALFLAVIFITACVNIESGKEDFDTKNESFGAQSVTESVSESETEYESESEAESESGSESEPESNSDSESESNSESESDSDSQDSKSIIEDTETGFGEIIKPGPPIKN